MDFPYPSELKSYIEQKEVVKYLNNYTDHFNLRPHIKVLQRMTNLRLQLNENRVSVLEAGGES